MAKYQTDRYFRLSAITLARDIITKTLIVVALDATIYKSGLASPGGVTLVTQALQVKITLWFKPT